MNYKVHIAYGFHVNCYHSYRGDTNDKQGFGGEFCAYAGQLDLSLRPVLSRLVPLLMKFYRG